MISKLNETKNLVKIKVLLNFIYYSAIVGIIGITSAYFILPSFVIAKPPIFMMIFSVSVYCCGIAIVYELIKINNTVIQKAPFVIENVKGMKRISAYLFIISVYVFIRDWLRFKTHIFHFDFDSTGLNTDTSCFIFLLLGIFVLILANIFKTAIEIKNENDLTI